MASHPHHPPARSPDPGFLFLLLALLGLSVAPLPAQNLADEAVASERLAALEAEQQSEDEALWAVKRAKPRPDDELKTAQAARDEKAHARAAEAFKIEAAHRGTDLGARALTFILRSSADDAPATLAILTDNYVHTPFARSFAGDAAVFDLPEAESFLKHLSKTNPDPETRALGGYCLGRHYEHLGRLSGLTLEGDQRRKDAAEQYKKVIADLGKAGQAEHDTALMAQGSLNELTRLNIGQAAPEIEGRDIDGKPLKLSDFRGRVVALVFWATWCGPCMAMVPHERELVARLKDRPFALVGVNGDTDTKRVRETMAREKMTWPSFYEGKGDQGLIPRLWNSNANGWPMIYVLDAQGIIRFKSVRGKEMDAAVDQLLAKLEKAPIAPK